MSTAGPLREKCWIAVLADLHMRRGRRKGHSGQLCHHHLCWQLLLAAGTGRVLAVVQLAALARSLL